jgi:hypothetical protein
MGLKWLVFLTCPLLQRFEHYISTRWMAYPMEAVATFLIIFGDHIYIKVDIKVKVLVFIELLHRSSPLTWTIELEKIIMFGAHSPLSYKHMSSFSIHFWSHIKTYTF